MRFIIAPAEVIIILFQAGGALAASLKGGLAGDPVTNLHLGHIRAYRSNDTGELVTQNNRGLCAGIGTLECM